MYHVPRAKRNKAQLMEYAESLGLKVEFRRKGYLISEHGVYSQQDGRGIHWEFGTKEKPTTCKDVEVILEQYAKTIEDD